MELNPRQQKLAFAVIVVILAGLGVYLLLPQATGSPRAATSTAPTPPPTAAEVSPAAPSTPLQSQPVATPSASGAANIFSWLPFTPADLTKAASVTIQAAASYDTFRYDESATTYGNRLSGLVTSQYLTVLEGDYSTYGVAKQRTKDKEVSTASAMINSLRAFSPSSITFVVTISQHVKKTSGTSSPSSRFAITVVQVGGAWQVDQIQPASAGNQ